VNLGRRRTVLHQGSGRMLGGDTGRQGATPSPTRRPRQFVGNATDLDAHGRSRAVTPSHGSSRATARAYGCNTVPRLCSCVHNCGRWCSPVVHFGTMAPTLTIRPTPAAAAALDAAHRATGGVLNRHRLTLAALTIGARAIAARPAALFELGPLGEEDLPRELVSEGPATPAEDLTDSAPAAAPLAAVAAPAEAPRPEGPSPGGGAPLAGDGAPRRRRRAPAPPAESEEGKARASAEELAGLRAAMEGAIARGGTLRAVCASAGITSGTLRASVSAVMAGEAPSMARSRVATLTDSARAFGAAPGQP
jgi:hypothetical protein